MDDLDIQTIRQLVTEGRLRMTEHAWQRMMDRQLFSSDVEQALLSGTIVAREDEALPRPTVTVRGHAKRVGEFSVVCCEMDGELWVVTVSPPRRRRR